MKKQQLPFFPLKLVAFPGEQVNLHIFEPRYKQLINDCLINGTTFGIPVFHQTILDYGAEMEVEEVVKTYAGGEMDIITRCIGAFKLESFQEKMDGKLYAGGDITRIQDTQNAEPHQWQLLKELAEELIDILNMKDQLDVNQVTDSFQLAHKLGLSLEQEYDMLQMSAEADRQDYMINHLTRALPFIKEMENAKERIKMNGHFQHHDPLNF